MLKKNQQLSLSLSIIIILGFTLFLGLVLRAPSYITNTTFLYEQEKVNLSAQAGSLLPVSTDRPVRLRIPKINVDATIEQVGITPDGTMDVPKGPQGVAWYMLGPKPGENGSSVFAGHSGWKNNIPAVFDDLYKLEKGDKIYVENDIGVTITFVVREFRTYDPSADARDVFISNDGSAHLNLITCTGFWNKIWKTHSDRLVVFTDKEI